MGPHEEKPVSRFPSAKFRLRLITGARQSGTGVEVAGGFVDKPSEETGAGLREIQVLPETRAISPRAWWTLFMLCMLYALSLVDRMSLTLFVTPLKRELSISDIQLGLLFGPAFAVSYCLSGLWLAWRADRGNRRRLIVMGVSAWSLSTILSGVASSFTMLVLCRLGLAIGEGVLVPCAYSLLPEMFPVRRRVLATSIFNAAGAMGAGGALYFTALLINAVGHFKTEFGINPSFADWRLVLICAGILGLIGASVYALTTREPTRMNANAGKAIPVSAVWHHIRDHGATYAGLFAGSLCLTTSYAFSNWSPTVLERNYGYTASGAGHLLGLWTGCAGLLGIFIAPLLAESLRRGRGVAINMRVAAVLLALGTSLYSLAPYQSTVTGYVSLLFAATLCLSGCTGICLTAYQILTPRRVIGTIVATHLTIGTIGGLGLGPPLAAWMGENLFGGLDGLAHALSLVAVLVGLPTSLALILGSLTLRASAELKEYLR